MISTASAASLELCPAAQKDTLVAIGTVDRPRLLEASRLTPTPVLNEEDMQVLKEFGQQLNSEGITLVALSVPNSALLYNKGLQLPDAYNLDAEMKKYNNRVEQARKSGILALNLLDVAKKYEASSGSEFFARLDHHWTGEAILASAKAAVAAISTPPRLTIDPNASIVTTQSAYPGSFGGNLVKDCPQIRLAPESRTFLSVKINSGESLLDGANTDTVIVGDSFAIDFFGFPQAVSGTLKTPVISAALNGGGPVGGIASYFASLTPDHKPKLMFWAAEALFFNANQLKEISASLFYSMHHPKALAEGAKNSDGTPMTINFPPLAVAQDSTMLALDIRGPKTERVQAELKYSDGTTETHTFYRRQDDPHTEYTVHLDYVLLKKKDLVAVTFTVPAGAKVTVGKYVMKL